MISAPTPAPLIDHRARGEPPAGIESKVRRTQREGGSPDSEKEDSHAPSIETPVRLVTRLLETLKRCLDSFAAELPSPGDDTGLWLGTETITGLRPVCARDLPDSWI